MMNSYYDPDASTTSPSSPPFEIKLYSQSTIDKILAPSIIKHQAAVNKRNETRDWCSKQLAKYRTYHTTDIHNSNNNNNNNNNAIPTTSLTSTIETYRDTIKNLNETLNNLKEECKEKSVLSASNSVKIQERIGSLEESKLKVQQMKSCLDHLYSSILISSSSSSLCQNNNHNEDDGKIIVKDADATSTAQNNNKNNHHNEIKMMNLSQSIHTHVKQVKYQRFQLAIKAFTMHRMDVGEEYNQLTFEELLRLSTTKPNQNSASIAGNTRTDSTMTTTTTTTTDTNYTYNHNNVNENKKKSSAERRFKRRIYDKQPNGIGKIGDMPVPHAGQELFGVLPPHMLSSTLRLIANLTSLLARCLGIVLPHPILLRPRLVTIKNMNALGQAHDHDGHDDGRKVNAATNDGTCASIKTHHETKQKKRYSYLRRNSSHKSQTDNNNSNSSNSNNNNNEKTVCEEFITNDIDEWLSQETGDIILSSFDQYSNDIDTSDLEFTITTFKDFEKLGCEGDGCTSGNMNRNHQNNEENHEDCSQHGLTTGMNNDANNRENTCALSSSSSSSSLPSKSKDVSSTFSSSTSSLISLVGSSSNILSRSARRAFVKMKRTTSTSTNNSSAVSNEHNYETSHCHHNNQAQVVQSKYSNNDKRILLVRKMDANSIKTRLKHASFAIVCESSKIHNNSAYSNINNNDSTQNENSTQSSSLSTAVASSSSSPFSNKSSLQSHLVQYELRPPRREDLDHEKERFTIGLQLLQNNIIALSIQAGVPIATLWPAEAMLLNLHSLRLYCLSQST